MPMQKKTRIANLLQGNKEIESYRKIEHLVLPTLEKLKKTIFGQCFYRIIN